MTAKANPAHRSNWDFAMNVIRGPTFKKILNVGHYHPVRAAQPGRAGAATASHDEVHEQLGLQSAQRLDELDDDDDVDDDGNSTEIPASKDRPYTSTTTTSTAHTFNDSLCNTFALVPSDLIE